MALSDIERHTKPHATVQAGINAVVPRIPSIKDIEVSFWVTQ